jgi:acylphosphatase
MVPRLRRSVLICDTALAVMVRHYIVKGRVQGVGFRWFVQREAFEIGLRGWVRNTADGDVEVLAAGSEERLKLRSCRHLKLKGHGDRQPRSVASTLTFSLPQKESR